MHFCYKDASGILHQGDGYMCSDSQFWILSMGLVLNNMMLQYHQNLS
jgi:hypothetical protein